MCLYMHTHDGRYWIKLLKTPQSDGVNSALIVCIKKLPQAYITPRCIYKHIYLNTTYTSY